MAVVDAGDPSTLCLMAQTLSSHCTSTAPPLAIVLNRHDEPGALTQDQAHATLSSSGLHSRIVRPGSHEAMGQGTVALVACTPADSSDVSCLLQLLVNSANQSRQTGGPSDTGG